MPMNDTRGLWRGKRVDNNGWVCGVPLQHCDGDWQLISGKVGAMIIDTIIPSTLGECTGLTDKNSKLIFEGDIISFVEIPEKYYVAKWDKENACFYFDRDVYVKACFAPQHGIIVGNIHDNPELLEGADKP